MYGHGKLVKLAKRNLTSNTIRQCIRNTTYIEIRQGPTFIVGEVSLRNHLEVCIDATLGPLIYSSNVWIAVLLLCVHIAGKVNDTMDGSGDDENEYNNQSSRRSSNIRDRLGRAGGEKRIQDRLGGRETNVSGDARKDIDRLRKKQSERGDKNVRSGYRDIGYEDEEAGVYHDIYRADDTKESNRKSDKNSRQRGDDNKNSASMTSSSRKRSPNNLKHRLGKSSDVTHDDDDRTSPRDLRDRLKNKGESRTREDKTGKFSRKEVKEEEDNLLNLCIEIKQERDPLEDIDIEMNDVGDEFEF